MSSQNTTENTTEKVINLIEELNMEDYYTEGLDKHNKVVKFTKPISKDTVNSLKKFILKIACSVENKCECGGHKHNRCIYCKNGCKCHYLDQHILSPYVDDIKCYVYVRAQILDNEIKEVSFRLTLNNVFKDGDDINSDNDIYVYSIGATKIENDKKIANLIYELREYLASFKDKQFILKEDYKISIIEKEVYKSLIDIHKGLGYNNSCCICLEDCIDTEHFRCCKTTIHLKCAQKLIDKKAKEREDIEDEDDDDFFKYTCPACIKSVPYIHIN